MGAIRQEMMVIGAGGFSRETAEAIRACIAAGAPWQFAGFLDDDAALHGRTSEGAAVLGPIALVDDRQDVRLVVGTGRPDNYWSRLRIVERLGLPAERFATVVHPGAALSASTTVGVGTVILASVVATAAVSIGAHVAVMPGVILTHDDVIADFATLTSGVRLGGGVVVSEGAYIGAGALIREGVSIGPWAMIGMGSVVMSDVPAGELWLGTPAHYHRKAPCPADLLDAAAVRLQQRSGRPGTT